MGATQWQIAPGYRGIQGIEMMDAFVSGGKSCLCVETPENLASGSLSFINCCELCGKRMTNLTEPLLFTKNCIGYRKYKNV